MIAMTTNNSTNVNPWWDRRRARFFISLPNVEKVREIQKSCYISLFQLERQILFLCIGNHRLLAVTYSALRAAPIASLLTPRPVMETALRGKKHNNEQKDLIVRERTYLSPTASLNQPKNAKLKQEKVGVIKGK